MTATTAQRYVVIDLESATEPGEEYDVLAVLPTLKAAEEVITTLPTEDVENGRYAIDGPEDVS